MMTRVRASVVVLVVVLATASVLRSPGTLDVATWMRWAANADTLGAVAGYQINGDYPPYGTVILRSAVGAVRPFGIGTFGAVKAAIATCLFLTSLVFWLWTRDFRLTVVLYLSLLLNSVALGYLDVLFAPSLLLSLWALQKRRLTLFAVSYALACLTKWQPVIVAPFLIVYLLRDQDAIRRALLPAAAVALGTASVFGPVTMAKAWLVATNNDFLSGNALNFGWVLTHALHVFYPLTFGGLVQGEASNIMTRSQAITFVPRLLFVLCYGSTLVAFFRRDRTFDNLLLFSIIGYLAYFIFNTGVHENHLFLVAVLSIVLYWANAEHLWLMVFAVTMNNVNLFLFYGTDGSGPGFSRAIAGTVDMALVLSVLNVSAFLVFWGVNVPILIRRS
jgi:Gpi18-like mannosyltransferase